MTVRSRLVTGLFMVAALFATQANGQGMVSIQTNQTAYQTLQSALQANSAGTEATDEAAVAAARAAGLTDAQIAGAMQESGRSVDQQVAALLPANPTQAQANNAANAVTNAVNSQGAVIGSSNAAAIAQGLRNAGVAPQQAGSIASNQVASRAGVPGALTPGGLGGAGSINNIASRLNNLSPTGAGTTPTFTPTTNLGGVNSGSGPNIAVAAFSNNVPVLQVNTNLPAGPAEAQVPTIPPFLGSTLHNL